MDWTLDLDQDVYLNLDLELDNIFKYLVFLGGKIKIFSEKSEMLIN